MRQLTKVTKTEEKFSDHLDGILHVIKVHPSDENKALNENYLLAYFGEQKEKYNKFIIQEGIAAKLIRNYIKDKTIAEETAKLIEYESEAHAILNRNDKNNPITMGIIDREKETNENEIEEKKENGIIKRIRGSIKPKDEKETEKD